MSRSARSLTVRRRHSRRSHLLFLVKRGDSLTLDRSQPPNVRINPKDSTWNFSGDERHPIGELDLRRANNDEYAGVIGVIDRMCIKHLNQVLRYIRPDGLSFGR